MHELAVGSAVDFVLVVVVMLKKSGGMRNARGAYALQDFLCWILVGSNCWIVETPQHHQTSHITTGQYHTYEYDTYIHISIIL